MDTIKNFPDYAIVTGYRTDLSDALRRSTTILLLQTTLRIRKRRKIYRNICKEIIRDSFCLEYGKGLVSIVEIAGKERRMADRSGSLAKGRGLFGSDLIYLPELPF